MMKAVYRCCCGIDVHKRLIVACLKKSGRQEVREFGTMTGEIKELAKWLREAGCEMAAMESTGVYWKPLYNLFEPRELDMMVVNAAHMKAVPGRKTDMKDAEWIAALLRQILDHIDDLDRRVAVLDGMVEQYMAEYAQALDAIDEIPGIALRSAQVILAEIGLDMERFPSAAHLCSWAGVSPGSHQSAGKRKHGRTNKGNKTLKSMMAQCAKAAGKVRNSYFMHSTNALPPDGAKPRHHCRSPFHPHGDLAYAQAQRPIPRPGGRLL